LPDESESRDHVENQMNRREAQIPDDLGASDIIRLLTNNIETLERNLVNVRAEQAARAS